MAVATEEPEGVQMYVFRTDRIRLQIVADAESRDLNKQLRLILDDYAELRNLHPETLLPLDEWA